MTPFFLFCLAHIIITIAYFFYEHRKINKTHLKPVTADIKDIWEIASVQDKEKIVAFLRGYLSDPNIMIGSEDSFPRELLIVIRQKLSEECKKIQSLQKNKIDKTNCELFFEKIPFLSSELKKEIERKVIQGKKRKDFHYQITINNQRISGEGKYFYEVGFIQNSPIFLHIIRKKWYHVMLSRFIPFSKVEGLDPEFSKQYLIVTDDDNSAYYLFQNSSLFSEIKSFFSHGAEELYIGYERTSFCHKEEYSPVIYTFENWHLEQFHILDKIHHILKGHNLLFQKKPKLVNHKDNLKLLYLVLFAFGLVGKIKDSFLQIHILNADILNEKAFLLAGSSIAVIFLYILYGFRKSSLKFYALKDFIMFGLIGFLFASPQLIQTVDYFFHSQELSHKNVTLRECILHCSQSCGHKCTRRSSHSFYNEECDEYARTIHKNEAELTDNICRSSSYYSYILHVGDYKLGQSPYEYTVSEEIFSETKVHDKFTVPVYDGILGTKWMIDDKIYK